MKTSYIYIPAQGKRKKPIKIIQTFLEPDLDRDDILNKQILKIVFGK